MCEKHLFVYMFKEHIVFKYLEIKYCGGLFCFLKN